MTFLEPDRYFSRLSHVDIERDILALGFRHVLLDVCLLYTSDAADD